MAFEYASAASDYQVTPQVITELQQNIVNYTPLIVQRNSISDKRSLATANLKALFRDSAKQLNLVNDLVKALIDDKAFADAFNQAKKMRSANKVKPEERKAVV